MTRDGVKSKFEKNSSIAVIETNKYYGITYSKLNTIFRLYLNLYLLKIVMVKIFTLNKMEPIFFRNRIFHQTTNNICSVNFSSFIVKRK